MDSTPEEEQNRAATIIDLLIHAEGGDLSRRSLMKIKSMRPCLGTPGRNNYAIISTLK